jgi:hypothetical protein
MMKKYNSVILKEENGFSVIVARYVENFNGEKRTKEDVVAVETPLNELIGLLKGDDISAYHSLGGEPVTARVSSEKLLEMIGKSLIA